MGNGGYMGRKESDGSQDMTDQALQPGAGNLGLSKRSYERLYYNARQALTSVDYLVNRMMPWAEEHVSDTMPHRRIVGRIIMTEAQLSESLHRSAPLREHVEVAVPVGDYFGSRMVMVMWGVNNHHEHTLDPVNYISHETEYTQALHIPPSMRVRSIREQRYEFVEHIDQSAMNDIVSLWGSIFEWTDIDVQGLRIRLQEQQRVSPEDRSVWFTRIMAGDDVVALAMAERLDLPLGGGDTVPIIESTEWCVRPGWQQRGLGIGAVSHVHAQVFRDLERVARQPIILAETNFTSRADRIGHGAGMVVGPHVIDSIYIPQVLRQNVAVIDARRSDRLRDFTMMYISPEHRDRYYSPEACEQIIGGTL